MHGLQQAEPQLMDQDPEHLAAFLRRTGWSSHPFSTRMALKYFDGNIVMVLMPMKARTRQMTSIAIPVPSLRQRVSLG